MTIAPLAGSSGPAAAGSAPADQSDSVNSGRAGKIAPATGRSAASNQDEAALTGLKEWASDRGLEVRYETLPDSKATVLRIIDSKTGQVLNELPPEGVAMALAEMQARADKKALDHRA